MMKRIEVFKIIFVCCGLLLRLSTLHAQVSASELLEWTKQHLNKGDCDKARETYKLYKDKVPAGNIEVERRIAECGQPIPVNHTALTITVNGVSFKMVYVEGGTFKMGCTSEQNDCRDNEKPVHWVTLSDFYIGEFEVTQELWQAVMGTSIYQQRDKWFPGGNVDVVGSHYPMYFVDDYEAEEFCSRINHLLRDELPTGYKIALPSEAQWEYAARGGNKSKSYTYAGSNYVSDVAYFQSNSSSLHEVGFKTPNELGLYDMSGNVWEMCADWIGDYEAASSRDPRGPHSGPGRVMRGGAVACSATMCRVTYRWAVSGGHGNVGFRLALVRR